MESAMRTAQEKRVTRIANLAAKTMGMAEQFELEYVFTDFDDDGQSGSNIATVYMTAAKTEAQWQYKRARVTWYLGRIVSLSDERLFAVAVHEFVHVLLNSLDVWLNDDDEEDDTSGEL